MLHVVVVTRNRSIYVKSLHTLLGVQALCAHVKLPIDLSFVMDNNKDKLEILKKKLKNADRVLWMEYGVSCDRESIHHFVTKYEGFQSLVFPVVKEGINWEMFKEKVKADSKEPTHQKGLEFDTKVSKCFDKEKDFYTVESTNPSLWAMDVKTVLKKIKDKKGQSLTLPPTMNGFFELCLKKGVKIQAATAAKTFNHFTHECVGNIMNMAGLKVTK